MCGCCQLRWSPWACLQAFKGPLHPSSCHKWYHLAFTAECRCSKHEGTIWSSANRWQAARWCHSATLIPWSAGRYMAWDATVVHTCAASYLSQSRQVLQLSRLPFARLPNTHCCLQPMCLSPLPSKLLGLQNAEGAEFLSELGRRISSVSGDQRETNFLLQRFSICVQRHNAIAFRGTFQDGREAWDEA